LFHLKKQTMLKKNLVKTSSFCPVLLLLFPIVTAMRTETKNSFRDKPIYINWQKAEVLISDSISLTSSEASLLSAPKILLNKNASPFVKSFLVREVESLQKTRERSAYYFKMMDGIFTRYGLPTELRYLAVVESDLRTTALSKVGAKGLWQFMPQTARDLGLTVKSKYDERTYAYKSTVAAARYLKDLYAQFGDWLLVIAAYNCGPVPVSKAIKLSGSKNFWALQYYLPKESRFHVKRFIGTHYYFEGTGSVVTMTRSETLKYQNQFNLYKASIQPNEIKKDSAIAAVTFKSF
jgi:membrane-bound lytic murein transglycosylase D